jgi:hypothetical protein
MALWRWLDAGAPAKPRSDARKKPKRRKRSTSSS